MCDICTTARRFPSVYHSLEFIAVQMRTLDQMPPCVDELVGSLAGQPAPTIDKKTEADWERAIHGQED